MAKIEKIVEDLIAYKIQELGYDLYDVEYVKEAKDYFLRIYIDNEKGITLEDCEKVSNCVNDILDEKDVIKEQYFLEVSSPGIERILKKDKHLEKNKGAEANVKLFNTLNGTKSIKGKLIDFNENEITILEQDKNLKIERKNIAQIKTIYNW